MDIPKGLSSKELGVKLTIHTVEVDGVETQADKFENIVVGKVLSVKDHPDADRLRLSEVDAGVGQTLHIVCGAPNLEEGQKVAVALVGSELPNGLVIEERKVRGEMSQGMICAEDELGLGEDHSGIMVLDKSAKVGKPLADHLKMDDVAFEIDNKSITNRPDLWGHLGMAREIAVFLEKKTTKKFKEILEGKIASKSQQELNIKVEDKELCPRYSAVKIEGLAVKESPKWIKDRLTVAGMRPINNIVDATNYVMLELGQPLHAFDAGKVEDIIVRRAKKGEKMETLDGEERELDPSMLLIGDKKQALAVAGVMGGKDSEVGVDTRSILLESANFEPVNIRRTSTKLGLRTESSMRFEKALNPEMTMPALARCLAILKETCPKAKVASQAFDLYNSNKEKKVIEVDMDWLNGKVGQELKEDKVGSILTGLGFTIDKDGRNWKIGVPSWRATKDIDIKDDIVEEVVRIYGYDHLETKAPLVPMKAPIENKERVFERKVKGLLAGGARMSEVYNYSFVSEDKLKKLKITPSSYIRLANPISNIHTLLRQHLFTNMLDNVKTNQARYERVSLFEIGNIYLDSQGGVNKDPDGAENLPYQEKKIGFLEAGSEKDDVYKKVKGKLEYLAESLGVSCSYEVSEMTPDWADKATYAPVKMGERDIGFVFRSQKGVLNKLGIKKEVAIAELSLSELVDIHSNSKADEYKEPAKYPAIERDLAFVVDSKVLYNDIKKEIEEFDELVSEVELFDVYEGDNLGKDKKSLAFHIRYQANDRTLESAEAERLADKICKELEEKYEAKIRDF